MRVHIKLCYVLTCCLTVVFAMCLLVSLSDRQSIGNEVRHTSLFKRNIGIWETRATAPQVTSHEYDTQTILNERKALVDKTCRTEISTNGKTLEITGGKSMNVSYCIIPKAGCTMWLRIFKYLEGQKRETGNPLSISKYEVHYIEQEKSKLFDVNKHADFIRNSWRVMTVRNPFTRLWSAYIDKLLLPDFWQTKGKMIIKLTRPGASRESSKCGHDVTFPEFIQFVVQTGHRLTHVAQDKHWLPESDLCDPCTFKPDVIAKQETFLADMAHVLEKTNKGDLLNKMKSTYHIEYEIEDEIKYNYEIYKMHARCISLVGLCKRMWMAFILNGYIPSTEMFPERLETSDGLKYQEFFSEIKSVRAKHNMTRDDTKRLRMDALATAYSSIPKENVYALQELYENDFRLFGYKRLPDFIKL